MDVGEAVDGASSWSDGSSWMRRRKQRRPFTEHLHPVAKIKMSRSTTRFVE